MTTHPNMATITASIERSLQNCSLNHHRQGEGEGQGEGGGSNEIIMSINNSAPPSFVPGRSSTSDSTDHHNNRILSDNTLELNSDIRLPYYWEQCLDLKTGEVYYINWRTGMKSHEDPRASQEMKMKDGNLLLCSEEEEDEEQGEEDSSYESQGSSTEESSSSTSTGKYCDNGNRQKKSHADNKTQLLPQAQVLVVAGCKSCFMYFMVPRHVGDCPKCFGQLLHFDPSQNAST